MLEDLRPSPLKREPKTGDPHFVGDQMPLQLLLPPQRDGPGSAPAATALDPQRDGPGSAADVSQALANSSFVNDLREHLEQQSCLMFPKRGQVEVLMTISTE